MDIAQQTTVSEDAVLRFVPDLFYVRRDGGVWLRAGIGSLWIKGEQAYDLIRDLWNRFDGEKRLAEVMECLPASKQQQLTHGIVEPLVKKGFLILVRAPQNIPKDASTWLKEEIAFLSQYVDDPVGAALKARSSVMVCAGSGPELWAAVNTLVQFEFDKVIAISANTDQDRSILLSRDQRLLDRRASSRHEIRFSDRLAEDIDRLADAHQGSTGAIILCGRAISANAAEAAMRVGHCRNFELAFVGESAGLAYSAPLSDDGWCWKCLAASFDEPGEGPTPAASAAIAALHVCQALFMRLAGVPQTVPPDAVSVDHWTLRTHYHQPRHAPGCKRTAIEFVEVTFDDVDVEPSRRNWRFHENSPVQSAVQERISAAQSGLVDGVLGPIVAMGEGHSAQIELSSSYCDVMLTDRSHGEVRRRLVAIGLSAREARNQAVLMALEAIVADRLAGALCIDRSQIRVAVGWSLAEACYRASAEAFEAEAVQLDAAPPEKLDPDLLTEEARYLFTQLRESSAPLYLYTSTPVAGLIRTALVCGGRTLHAAVGVDCSQSAAQVLIQSFVTQMNDEVGHQRSAVRLHPQGTSWNVALSTLLSSDEVKRRIREVRGALPFPIPDARVVVFE